MNKGILYGIGAYILWGFFPIYWKLLHQVPALELVSHRIVWSFLMLMAAIFITRQGGDFRKRLTKRVFGIYLIAAALIGANWGVYVWAVNAGHIVESSLGYFINPLVSVLLGLVILREKLRPAQWGPVLLALSGVVYLTVTFGRLPWIALTLACTFGFYGLVKKLAPLSSLYGLTLETGILFIPAFAILEMAETNGTGTFLHTETITNLMLLGSGVVTIIPLLMFASAARRIPLTMVGVLQYIAPTLQFLIGVFLYREPFDHTQLIGFSLVWLALILFWVENYMTHRALHAPQTPIPEMGEG